MGSLWADFLADLERRVDQGNNALLSAPEVVGERLAGPYFAIDDAVTLPDGATLAAVNDGLHRPRLVRFDRDGRQRRLARLNSGARLSVAADGRVLLAQPDVCDVRYLSYDLYRLVDGRLRRLTHCAHWLKAADAGDRIIALQLDAGRTRLVELDADGRRMRLLWQPPAGTDLVDLAVAPDARSVAFITRNGSTWQLLSLALDSAAAPQRLLVRNRPMQGLRAGPAGLEFVAIEDNVPNVWRLGDNGMLQLTRAHTAVSAHAGTAADGSLTSVVITADGDALQRLSTAEPLPEGTTSEAPTFAVTTATDLPTDPGSASERPAAPTPQGAPVLGRGRDYSALRSLYPRSWFPLIVADHGLTALGASTYGSDALRWHQYSASLLYESSQQEVLGSLEYAFIGNHTLAISRDLSARSWDDEDIETYDRNTRAQWLSFVPWLRLERRLRVGIGAAADHRKRVDVVADTGDLARDERVAAALIDFDTSNANWYSEGPNRGWRGTLLYETYAPFDTGDTTEGPDYDGDIVRLDLRGFVPIATTVLALHWTEVRASGVTEPFQLGGATDAQLQFAPVLNDRDLALRGYSGHDSELRGQNARVASAELRFPIADIDRHAMAPPIGINRLSGTVFVESGGVWESGDGPDPYFTGAGFELLGELKLLYVLGLQLRVGVAHGFDGPQDTRGYLQLGRAF